MKVGKKVLSMVLAIVMVISSVSVCFGVLGSLAAPETEDQALANLMSQIELHYATLADCILDAEEATGENSADALKMVPRSTGTGLWEVELDTSKSSWYWVTSAYAHAAAWYVEKGKEDGYSIAGVNNAIKGYIAGSSKKVLPVEKYNEILDRYLFSGATASITLNIGEGFDILQWAPDYDAIPATEDDLQLYNAVATFTVDSAGYISEVDFVSNQPDSKALAGNMKMVKEAIADFIGKADTWFNTDYTDPDLSVETLNTIVKAISEDIVAYELAVTVGNYEEVWDAYVAPKIAGNRKWAEVKQWYKTNIVGYVANAYAAQYQSAIEGVFTTANDQTKGADLLESYKLIQAQLDKLNDQTAYNGDETVNITDMIIEAFAKKNDLAAAKYYAGVLSRHEALGHKLAEAFANEQFEDFVEQFMAMVDTATTKHTYVTSTEAKAMGHKWEVACSGNCNQKCPASGKVTKADDGTITGFTYTGKDEAGNDVEYTCTQLGEHCVHDNYNFAEKLYFGTDDEPGVADVIAIFEQNVFPYITDAAGTVQWALLVNVGKDSELAGTTNFITLNEDNWNKYYNAAGVVNLDVNGATYKEYKANMDAYMDAAILTGSMTYSQITGMVDDMLAMGYKSCKELSNNAGTKDLFAKIFGEEGMKPYDEFINDLKRRAVNRIYDLVSQVYYYYDEGDGKIDDKGLVAYHNFEAILSSYSAISGEAVPGVLLKFINSFPAYNPEAEQFADKVAEDASYVRTFTEVSKYYDSVTTGKPSIIAQAEEYRTMLNSLRDKQSGGQADNTIRNMLFDRYNNANNYNDATMYQYIWQSKIGTLDYSFVKAILDAVGVKGDARDLVNTAIDAIDSMLISEDMGTLLGALLMGNKHQTKVNKDTGITKYGYIGTPPAGGTKKVFWIDDHTNANAANLDGTSYQGYTLTAMTNSLGYWEYSYAYDHDGNPNTAKITPEVGTECKNIKEWLVAMIINYLFSGELHTMLFKLLNEMVGAMIYDMEGTMQAVKALGITAISTDDNSHYFPAFLRCTLATMPHIYTANSSYAGHGANYDIDQGGVQFYKWFDGSIWGSTNNYSKVLELCSKAPWVTQSKEYSRTYWADGELKNYSRHKTVKGIPAEAWASFDSKEAWNIESFDDFYKALASATCGYQPILSGLITSDESTYVLKIKLLDSVTLDGTIKFWASEDNIYDNLLVPLYEILGITGYPTASQISTAGAINDSLKMGDTNAITGYGYDLWSLLLSPIFNWLDSKLLANPVQEILNLLPNLMAALEYNQLYPKIQNIILSFNYKLEIIGIQAANSTDNIKLSKDTILPLLDGIDLRHGLAGLLESLSKITMAAEAPTYSDTKDKDGNLPGNYYSNYIQVDDTNDKGEVLYYNYNENGSNYDSKYTDGKSLA